MKTHIKNVHEGHRYDCSECPEQYASRSGLSAILTIVEFFYCPNAVCRNDYC